MSQKDRLLEAFAGGAQLTVLDAIKAYGCYAQEKKPWGEYKALDKVHYFTLLEKYAHGRWLMRCVCGTETVRCIYNLFTKRPSRSCGCKKKELLRYARTTHGCSKKLKNDKRFKTFVTWQSMLWRCYNKNRKDYIRYGGRGITVCERWRTDFSAFLADMGLKEKGLSIGRIDNDAGYSPENCRWETNTQQARNKITNHFLEFQNKKMTITEWALLIGLSKSALEKRLSNGWNIQRALSTPARAQNNSRCTWLAA